MQSQYTELSAPNIRAKIAERIARMALEPRFGRQGKKKKDKIPKEVYEAFLAQYKEEDEEEE